MRTIGTIQGNDVIELDDGSVRFFAGATLDGDGANGQFGQPPCYAPASYHGQTLDVIGNAGHPGNWFGVVTDTGDETGTPIVQKATDPAPARMFRQLRCTCPTKMDSHCRILPRSNMWTPRQFPFIVVPPMIVNGVSGSVLGCRCLVTNSKTGKTTEAVVADTGPSNHLGEISVACAKAIGVSTGTTHPANGGGAASPTIRYQLFPGTAAVVNGVTYPLQPS